MENNENYEKNKNAFDFANSCRDKEIDRFWSRALYFWGFIAAAFTAYITVLKLSLGQRCFCFKTITELNFTVKIILALLSFVCFVFCLMWQLIHKASKFWQENWEKYVCEFEDEVFGEEVYRKLKKDKIDGSFFPLSLKPYGYSVSKISSSSAVLLTVLSFVFTIFNFANLFQSIALNSEIIKIIIATVLSLLAFVYTIALLFLCKRRG